LRSNASAVPGAPFLERSTLLGRLRAGCKSVERRDAQPALRPNSPKRPVANGRIEHILRVGAHGAPFAVTERTACAMRTLRLLLTDEKIPFNGQQATLYLVESGSFGGNSGSPVYSDIGIERTPGSINLGPHLIKLAGIMEGTYQDIEPLSAMNTANVAVSKSTMGIAAVVPAYKLYNILFSDELVRLRRQLR
jgi:hypothetical protein